MRRRVLIAVVIPVLALAAWTSRHALIKYTGTEVELPILGFDPRDLLSGHYLRFRIDYGKDIKLCQDEYEACVCLTQTDTGLWQGSPSPNYCHDVKDRCEVHLRGHCSNGNFDIGIERYYFAEKHSKKLAVVPPKATVTMRVGDGGVAVIDELKVDGKPIKDFLKRD